MKLFSFATQKQYYSALVSNLKQHSQTKEAFLSEEVPQQENLQSTGSSSLFNYYTAKLSPSTRRVFLLRRQSGYSKARIAKELNISIETVENQMGKATKKLSTLLKNNPDLLNFVLSNKGIS